MADKIQNAYESSKHIYDDVLTQGSILSKLYIKNTSGVEQMIMRLLGNYCPIFQTITVEIFLTFR